MHQALYRKYRPRDFESVYGQDHITSVLKYEVESGQYSHAYLFCGSRGTGKTSCAKLLAKAVNCLAPRNGSPCCECEACRVIESETVSDVVEMDAASNTGVDYIRDIREAVMYAPSMLKNRVYIIDEVHMLTQSAFNALLKTLEEPPSNVVFILATTEQQKIPATILSRCQKFEFRRIPVGVIADRLRYISGEENIKVSEEALRLISKAAQGGMRDAVSLLELCSGDGKEIGAETVRKISGAVGREEARDVVEAVARKDIGRVFVEIDKVVTSSKDLSVFWQELMDYYRDMLVIKNIKEAALYLDLTDEEAEETAKSASMFEPHTLIRHCSLLEDAFLNIQRAGASRRLVAEMSLIKMCDESVDTSVQGLVSRIAALEEKLLSGDLEVPVVQNTGKSAGDENGGFIRAGDGSGDKRATSEVGRIQKNKEKNLKTGEALKGEGSVQKNESVPSDKIMPPKSEEFSSNKKTPGADSVVAGNTVQKSSDTSKREPLKPVTWWVELIKKIHGINPSLSPWMKMSKAYYNDDKILIKAQNGMAYLMLDTPEVKAQFSKYSHALSGERKYSDKDFQVMESGGDDVEPDGIDLLAEDAD